MGRRFVTTEEGIREQTVRELLSKALPLFKPHWKLMLGGFGLLIPVTAALLAPGLVLAHIIDKVFPTGDLVLLLYWTAGLLLIAGTGAFLAYVQAMALFTLGLTIITDLKQRLFEHTLKLGLDFHQKNSPGKLLSRVEADAETLGELFGETAASLLKNFIMFIAILVILCLRDFQIGMWILILVPLVFGGVFWFLVFMRKFWMEIRARNAIILGYVTEYVQGVEVIQQFNYQATAQARMHDVNMGQYRVRIPTAVYFGTFMAGFQFGQVAAIILIVVIGFRSAAAGTLSPGVLVLFIEYVRQMYKPILQLSGQLMFVQRSLVSVERVFGILETSIQVPDGSASPDEFSFEKEIRFENVWFAYEEENWVLRDVSFTINKGQSFALVGSSGGGKSTIVSLLLRFYDPARGRITVDGRDIRDFPVKTWRKNLGLVLQDIFLFPGSVEDNLRVFDGDVNRDKVREVSKIAHADSIIENLPGGYDGELSERGANLSVGERQLLSFARALAHDPPMLVLDEATSSVDPHTERLVQEALERLLKGRTAVIVAHRLSTILNSDCIILVENGKITESGSHNELIARDGIYARMFRLQFFRDETIPPERGDAL